MAHNNNYYTLMASLPALPARFEVDRCPITWPRLQNRLKLLEPADAETLNRLIDFLAWDRQPLDRTDSEVGAHYKLLVESNHHPVVRSIMDERIDMRTIVSALRRRRLGLGPPTGVGQFIDPIRRRWNQPQFGLQARFPWMGEFERLLLAGSVREAEKLILSISWAKWSREADHHHFSFAAVLLYVARWSIVNRWTSQDAAAGRARFENTLSTLLENHVHLTN